MSLPSRIFIIEVQHSSDENLDGSWHELDRSADADHAASAARWFRRQRGYKGRRVRVRETEGVILPMPRPNPPPPAWKRAVERAKRMR